MLTRDPKLPATRDSFDNHLSWTKTPTPFISFFNSYQKVVKRRQWMLASGAKSVAIIAIWAKDLRVYDAYDAAKALGYDNDGSGNRRRLKYHEGEYLVEGGIVADEYRVLAIFDGIGEMESIKQDTPGIVGGSAAVPPEWLRGAPGVTMIEKIEMEIYGNTGIRGHSEMLVCLVLSLIDGWAVMGMLNLLNG